MAREHGAIVATRFQLRRSPRPGEIYDPVARALERDRRQAGPWCSFGICSVGQPGASRICASANRHRPARALGVVCASSRRTATWNRSKVGARSHYSAHRARAAPSSPSSQRYRPLVGPLTGPRRARRRYPEALHRHRSAQSILEVAALHPARGPRGGRQKITFEVRLTGEPAVVSGRVRHRRRRTATCVTRGFAPRADVRYTGEARRSGAASPSVGSTHAISFKRGLLSKEGGREAMDTITSISWLPRDGRPRSTRCFPSTHARSEQRDLIQDRPKSRSWSARPCGISPTEADASARARGG